VHQSTISRYLQDLGVKKNKGFYEALATKETLGEKIVSSITVILPNLLILKTKAGHANFIASHIDGLKWEGLAGTIAGDDTIFVAVETPQKLWDIKKNLIDFLHETLFT
jgi:transcriptional regulator of arginine metabolism